MISTIAILFLAGGVTVSAAAAHAQEAGTSTDTDILATVRISQPVLANGKPLPPGTYELRLTRDRPTPLAGQAPDAERWVELVANGSVVGREVAVVLRDEDRPPVGASSVVAAGGTRVEMLKDGDFLRISVKRGSERYLLYLPVVQ